jgi:hypothetical protein
MEELLVKYKVLEEENANLKKELTETKEHLKKYTAPSRSKKFYETHKEEILEKKKDPKVKEQRKEINKRAYQKKKEKLKEAENIKENNI